MTRNIEHGTVNVHLYGRWQEIKDNPSNLRNDWEKQQLAEDVIRCNKNLIGSAIRHYTSRSAELEQDLFNTAAAELWRAFQKWDPSRSTLRTTAMPYINGAVRREVATQDFPHLSYDEFTLRGKLVKLRREFEEKNEREPSFEELSELSEGVPVEKIRVLFAANPLSLDGPGNSSSDDGETRTLGSVVAEGHADMSEDSGTTTSLNSQLEPEIAENAEPLELIAFCMKQAYDSGVPARTSEVAYLMGLPSNGKDVPRMSQRVALRNAYKKLEDMTGGTPDAEQLSMVANVRVQTAEEFLASV